MENHSNLTANENQNWPEGNSASFHVAGSSNEPWTMFRTMDADSCADLSMVPSALGAALDEGVDRAMAFIENPDGSADTMIYEGDDHGRAMARAVPTSGIVEVATSSVATNVGGAVNYVIDATVAAFPNHAGIPQGDFNAAANAAVSGNNPITSRNNPMVSGVEGGYAAMRAPLEDARPKTANRRKRNSSSCTESSSESSASGSDGNIICELCGYNAKSASALKGHMNKHVKYCKKCGLKFVEEGPLEMHMAVEHPPQYKCKICGHIDTNLPTLVMHVLRHKALSNAANMVYEEIIKV